MRRRAAGLRTSRGARQASSPIPTAWSARATTCAVRRPGGGTLSCASQLVNVRVWSRSKRCSPKSSNSAVSPAWPAATAGTAPARSAQTARCLRHRQLQRPGPGPPSGAVTAVIHTAQAARRPNLRVELSGQAIENAQPRTSSNSTALGLILAIILGLVFAALFAAITPIVTALVAIGIGYGTTGLLSHALTTSASASTTPAPIPPRRPPARPTTSWPKASVPVSTDHSSWSQPSTGRPTRPRSPRSCTRPHARVRTSQLVVPHMARPPPARPAPRKRREPGYPDPQRTSAGHQRLSRPERLKASRQEGGI